MSQDSPTYVTSHDCLLEIRRRLDALTQGVDPAPWIVGKKRAYPHDDQALNLRQTAIAERANLCFFRAMLTGSLRAWFSSQGERWQIPGWVWADQGGDWKALIMGNDFLHPLLPLEIRRWAHHEVLVEKVDFIRWLSTSELEDRTGFPNLPAAFDETERVRHVQALEPPHKPNVPLANAVSWLAFGISMDAETLVSALAGGFVGASRVDAHKRLSESTETLATAGTGGLPLFGKFVDRDANVSAAMTNRISPEKLEDFRQLDVSLDGLCYGKGLSLDWTNPRSLILKKDYPVVKQRFVEIKVNREGLMALQDNRPRGFSTMGNEVGDGLPIWLDIYQLSAWVLYREPAIVAKVHYGQGLAAEQLYGGQAVVGSLAQLQQWLQSGELIAHGAKRGESFAVIPPVEWTRLRIAPLDMAHQSPYVSIQVSRADAEALFPAAGARPIRTAAVASKRRPGRTPGSGSYASADAPLLSEMAEHIASGKAMSPHAAAQLVADRASGGGSFNSKVSRLAKAYRFLEQNGANQRLQSSPLNFDADAD